MTQAVLNNTSSKWLNIPAQFMASAAYGATTGVPAALSAVIIDKGIHNLVSGIQAVMGVGLVIAFAAMDADYIDNKEVQKKSPIRHPLTRTLGLAFGIAVAIPPTINFLSPNALHPSLETDATRIAPAPVSYNPDVVQTEIRKLQTAGYNVTLK